MSNNYTGAPHSYHLGISDKSKGKIFPAKVEVPQHMPLMLLFAPKGTTEAVPSDANGCVAKYGDEAFDELEPYYNHSTRYVNLFRKLANNMITKRVVPEDAGPKANVRVFADCKVAGNIYGRDQYGVKTGDVLVTGSGVSLTYEHKNIFNQTKNGGLYSNCEDKETYLTRVSITDASTPEEVITAMSEAKGMIVGDCNPEGNKYPLMDLEAKYQGKGYNNIGYTFGSYAADDSDPALVKATNNMVYKMIQKEQYPNISTNFVINKTLLGSSGIACVLGEKVINRSTRTLMDAEFIHSNGWTNTDSNNGLELKFSDTTDLYMYRENGIDVILDMIATAEFEYFTAVSANAGANGIETVEQYIEHSDLDITADSTLEDFKEQKYRFNIFTMKSTSGVTYASINEGVGNGVPSDVLHSPITAETVIRLDGGGDGTMNNETFASAVLGYISKYMDKSDDVQDLAVNYESVFYDTGLPVSVKEKLNKFISVRKDTGILVQTAVDGGKPIPMEEEVGLGNSLQTQYSLTPESVEFGTTTARAVVVGYTGIMEDNVTRVGSLYDLAYKNAKYFGHKSREWVEGQHFTGYPHNVISTLHSIEPKSTNFNSKQLLYGANVVFPDPYDKETMQFKSVQTIYEDETSILNQWPVIMAFMTLTKVANETHRVFAGRDDLNNDQFAAAVVMYVNGVVSGMFDEKYKVLVEVEFTQRDIANGGVWRLVTKLGAHNDKRIQIHRSEAYRYGSLN